MLSVGTRPAACGNSGPVPMRSHFSVKLPKLFVFFLVFTWCLSATNSRSDEPDKAAPPAADSMLGQKAGQVRDDNGLKMRFAWCPRGTITMECAEIAREFVEVVEEKDDDLPRVRRLIVYTERVKAFVTAYWIGKYEVTRSEWKQVMRSEPWRSLAVVPEGNDFPATHVSWDNAVEFCTTLTQQEPQRRDGCPRAGSTPLPTEAQWERACRARTETEFCFGDDAAKLREYGWFNENTAEDARVNAQGNWYAHRVGQLKPNAWGLYAMHGNVAEWCKDDFVEAVRGGVNPAVTTEGPERVVRGGSWKDHRER